MMEKAASATRQQYVMGVVYFLDKSVHLAGFFSQKNVNVFKLVLVTVAAFH
jgi:hypothetical protein